MFAVFVRALNNGLVLTIHHVDDDRLISFQKDLPTFFGNDMVRSSIVIFGLSIGFIDNSIEIFM